MIVTKEYIQEIIKEEITLMIQEGIIDEGLSDVFGGIGRKLASKAAQMTGLTPQDLKKQQSAAAAEKGKKIGFANVKQKAQQKVDYVKNVEKAASTITSKLATIDNDIDKLEEIVGYMKKMPGADGKQQYFNADNVRKAADVLFKEIEKIVNGVKGSEYGSAGPTIKEKKE